MTVNSLLQLERAVEKQSRLTEVLVRRNFLRQFVGDMVALDGLLVKSLHEAGALYFCDAFIFRMLHGHVGL
jgi:hypothetical protein